MLTTCAMADLEDWLVGACDVTAQRARACLSRRPPRIPRATAPLRIDSDLIAALLVDFTAKYIQLTWTGSECWAGEISKASASFASISLTHGLSPYSATVSRAPSLNSAAFQSNAYASHSRCSQSRQCALLDVCDGIQDHWRQRSVSELSQ
jgi:hypothetical protein